MRGDRTQNSPPLVLVVEDNPVNLELVFALLEEQACKVLTARTGDAALQILATSRPDLILMDVQLPGMNGYQVTRRIKAIPALAGIPVVVLTAHALASDQALAREAGCSAFLAKPIDVRMFKETLRVFLKAES